MSTRLSWKGLLLLSWMACIAGCGTESAGDGARDSDGDGFTNADEARCGSDPVDSVSTCYRCGWQRWDLGDLIATGNEEGDTLENVELLDQCGDQVPLWDFAGAYHILFMTGAW